MLLHSSRQYVFLLITTIVTSHAQVSAPAESPVSSPIVAAAKPTPKPRTSANAITPAIKNPERHEKFLEQAKEGNVGLLFLGDSITDFWPKRSPETWQEFEPYRPANFGISGDRTEHVLWRITNGELEGITPKVTVVMIGTNNIAQPSEEPTWTAEGVKTIVRTIEARLPHTKILLLAVFPRDTNGNANRLRVAELNKEIAHLADDKRIRYLDIGGKFLDDQGQIPPDIMPDKLHPSAKGYEIWYEAMQQTLAEMMK